ncbi:hypothetical protein PTKIN_Ptkin04bG0238300 [Pterospermum kingtungense]
MSSEIQIWVVPFFGQGHLLPSMELCKHIASRSFKTILIISSNLSSSIPSSFQDHPLIEVAQIPSLPPSAPDLSSGPPNDHPHNHHSDLVQGIEKLLENSAARPDCVIIDVMMDWTADIFKKFDVPKIGFLTSGACSATLEYAMWKARVVDIKPGEKRLLPGLPEEMALTDSDLKHGPPPGPPPPGLAGFGFPRGQPRPPPPGHGRFPGAPPQPGEQPPWMGAANDSVASMVNSSNDLGGQPRPPPLPGHGFPPGPPGGPMGPPQPGGQPPWLEFANDSVALMINSCNELERPFLDYLGTQIGKPVWGVGPLLPQQFWKSSDSLLHDREIRANKQSNVTEDEVMEWLDSKPHGSVLYVSFGSEVAPTKQEFEQLAGALEESKRPFIWVIQHGSGRPGPPPGPPHLVGNQPPGSSDDFHFEEESYYPHGLDQKVGERGLIIHGWAPQLLILSHPSTGAFLSHCGWNSTVEAIGRGVPILAWPIRGDQHYNAKLVVNHLKVGCMVSDNLTLQNIKKDDITKGIEKLKGNEELKRQAVTLSTKFHHGFPASSAASLDAYKDFIVNRNAD